MSNRHCLLAAGIFGALGILMGAFGAHALDPLLAALDVPEGDFARRGEILEIGVRYQIYHAVALLGLAALMDRRSNAWLSRAALLWVAGTVLFSGSLYGIVFAGINALGAITPLGGLTLIAGWVLAGLAAVNGDGRNEDGI